MLQRLLTSKRAAENSAIIRLNVWAIKLIGKEKSPTNSLFSQAKAPLSGTMLHLHHSGYWSGFRLALLALWCAVASDFVVLVFLVNYVRSSISLTFLLVEREISH